MAKQVPIIIPVKQEAIKSKMLIAGLKNLEKGKWKKGQSGNSKGRTPKSFIGIARMYQKMGYTQVTAAVLLEAYQILLSLPPPELVKIVNDSNTPMALSTTARRMINKEHSWDTIEKMYDRVHGKSAQITKVDMVSQSYHFTSNLTPHEPTKTGGLSKARKSQS